MYICVLHQVYNAWVAVLDGLEFRAGGEARLAQSGSELDARIANSGAGSSAPLTHTLIVSPHCITTYLTTIIYFCHENLIFGVKIIYV